MQQILRCQFVGVHELRQRLPQLLDGIARDGADIVVTRQGKPAAVLIDVEKYLEWQEALREHADPTRLADLLQAAQEIQEGGGIPAEEVFRKKGL